ncbi:hypothetical protein HNQ02_001390 [Flavobacterium sp. 7E]|uniref:choice-of-anchor Q domain-containing protein n=1 Tax=Flavobacterium sp. 7E TaxID=2735898 RepID=UPI00156F6EB0|nr:choice-of-anchor Q domain-containing protein [Flavobacterium sp. 7E]NRS88476.1 hypothetical protein [Flavobacterium sp. 7E]
MKKSIQFLFCYLLIGFSIYANANNVYVATNGNNSNSGTSSAPWKTIQYAVDNANAGTTIYVYGGTYSEKVLFSGSADSGISGSEVVLRNMPGETPIIDGTALSASDREGLISIVGSSHIKIYGFELRNFIYSGTTNTPVGFYMEGTCTNITFSNNKIHDIKNNSTCQDPCGAGAHGIGVFGTTTTGITNITFDSNEIYNCILQASEAFVINGNVNGFLQTNNYVHDNNNIGYDYIGYEGECSGCSAADTDRARNGIVKNNRSVNNRSDLANPWYNGDESAGGFYVDGGKDILFDGNISTGNNMGFELASEHKNKNTENIIVRNNYIYKNTEVGISIGGSVSNAAANNIAVVNNTFYKNHGWGSEIVFQKNVTNSFIQNNIFYADNTAAYENQGSGSTGNTWSNNLYYNGTAGSGSVTTADPKLIDPANGNLDLSSTSAAINKGSNTANNIGTTDIKGNNRIENTTVDIGAFEYKSGNLSVATYEVNNGITIFPVPVVNELNIILEDQSVITRYEIIAINGITVVKQKKNSDKNIVIPVNHLANGQYIINLFNQNSLVKSLRFLK